MAILLVICSAFFMSSVTAQGPTITSVFRQEAGGRNKKGDASFPLRSFMLVPPTFLILSHWSGEKAMAPHSSTLAWKIPWTEEPGRLQSMGSHSQTRLSDFTFTFHFHALEKAMATHSSLLAWRIPGTGEPGELPFVGSHKVGHDWSDLTSSSSSVLLGNFKNLFWFPCWRLAEIMRNNLQQHFKFLPEIDYSGKIDLCYRDSVLTWSLDLFSAGFIYLFTYCMYWARGMCQILS